MHVFRQRVLVKIGKNNIQEVRLPLEIYDDLMLLCALSFAPCSHSLVYISCCLGPRAFFDD